MPMSFAQKSRFIKLKKSLELIDFDLKGHA